MNSSYFFIGLGGAAGAISRVLLMRILPPLVLSLPVKILLVNVIGCLSIGILTEVMAFFWDASINTKHFLVQGFLGGFTTFSAFALEFGLLYDKGAYFSAILYALLSVVLSISFFFLGLKLVKLFV
ncbi:MAG: CrcB family protein [Simkaniaceae bacterium]|nr:CrcB family protein [Candidatus Sacchlamyda saccharinae]